MSNGERISGERESPDGPRKFVKSSQPLNTLLGFPRWSRDAKRKLKSFKIATASSKGLWKCGNARRPNRTNGQPASNSFHIQNYYALSLSDSRVPRPRGASRRMPKCAQPCGLRRQRIKRARLQAGLPAPGLTGKFLFVHKSKILDPD